MENLTSVPLSSSSFPESNLPVVNRTLSQQQEYQYTKFRPMIAGNLLVDGHRSAQDATRARLLVGHLTTADGGLPSDGRGGVHTVLLGRALDDTNVVHGLDVVAHGGVSGGVFPLLVDDELELVRARGHGRDHAPHAPALVVHLDRHPAVPRARQLHVALGAVCPHELRLHQHLLLALVARVGRGRGRALVRRRDPAHPARAQRRHRLHLHLRAWGPCSRLRAAAPRLGDVRFRARLTPPCFLDFSHVHATRNWAVR